MKYDPKKVTKLAEYLVATNNLPVSLMEKDVWLTYILNELYSIEESKQLAFKGGTCLVKAYYGYYRFSEDIDLTWTGIKVKEHEFRNKVIKQIMTELGLEWYHDEKVKTGIAGTQSGNVMSYFLLAPTQGSQPIKLKITVAFKEKLEFKPKQIQLKTPIPVNLQKETVALYAQAAEDYFKNPAVLCYALEEIACEKIRAILTRKEQLNRSRDIVDLYKISKDLKGLKNAAPPKQAKAKLVQSLKIPSYATEYARNTQNLGKHLEKLVIQASIDPVFIEKPDQKELSKFAKELEKYITKEIIPTLI